MNNGKTNMFGKLGHLITKRKFAIIGIWILLLAIILPVALTASGVSSLTMEISTDSSLESSKANDIIKAQFQKTVSNDQLIIVISTDDASSIATQQFIDDLSKQIDNNPSITGIDNITSIYSILIPVLNQTNQGVYLAYNNGNLTYTMLYSVPTIYSTVWNTAYNEALNGNLIPGLIQTNQAVYALLENANMTYNLLYSVPAIYLNTWGQAYQATANTTQSNLIAYQQTDTLLQLDPTSYIYTSQLLYAFNTTWTYTFLDPATASLTPQVRASLASNITNQQYINNAFGTNETAKAFATALTASFSLDDYLSNTQEENNQQLTDFSIQYIASSGGASSHFVQAAYNLGTDPSTSSLRTLANKIIWSPDTYGMSEDFISLFNQVSYDQTASILEDADAESYIDYTSHLLDYFDAAWSDRVPSSPAQNWINSVASGAADVANAQFINEYLGENKDFAEAIASTFSLQDFLDADSNATNNELQDLAISYVSNSSGLSSELVTAIYNMGENATLGSLQNLASKIVSNPSQYGVGEQLNFVLSSFVSPSNDVTLISIAFDDSDNDNLLAIRSIITSALTENPVDIKQVQVTGEDAISYDYMQATFSDLDLILPITIALLVIATAVFFRSIVTPIITLGTIGVGLGVSQIFPYLVGTYINQVDYTINTILLTVLIGVGTDYSIFIIARHREERVYGLSLFDSIKKSITWAGESIVTSGATVIISFLALSFTAMVFLQTMGLIIGLGVIATLLASLTFAPALTAILGDRIFWPNSGERFKRYSQAILKRNHQRSGYFAKSGSFSVKHGKVIILLAILVTVPTFYVYATTIPTYDLLGSASDSLESVSAMNALTDSFGSGRLSPTYVVLTFSQPLLNNDGSFNMDQMATINSVTSYISSHEGIEEATGPTMPYGKPVNYQTITNDSDSTTYSSIINSIGDDNQSALVTVKFEIDPYSTAAMEYTQNIRETLHSEYDDATNLIDIYVGGTSGSILDNKNSFDSQFNSIVPIVALGVGIVLFLVLGSIILPIFAILSVLMSIVWTLALTILVFQSAFGYGLLFITPLILFVLLLGLGMDYNIFILTRIREEAAKGQNLNDAIIHAIQQTGGIITAAAIILAGSLGALILSSNMMLKEMGFAFAFSILIDALVVRTYLVPAVMAVFGKWNWYNPIKRLRRIPETENNNAKD